MDLAADLDPFPLVLPGPRPVRWLHLGLLAGATTAVIVITFSVDCSGCVQWGLTLGFFGALATIVAAVTRIQLVRGKGPRELVIDREGLVNEGRRVPWESVMSIKWVADAGGETGMPEHIRLNVRSIPGFEAPRHRVVHVFHSAFGIAPNKLIYLFEAAALPRRLTVLAVQPPSSRPVR